MGALTDMAGAPAPKKKGGGFFGGLLDALAYGPFAGQARQNREIGAEKRAQAAAESQAELELKQSQIEKLRNPPPRLENVAGGLYRIDAATGQPTVLIPPKPDAPPAVQQNLEWYKGLTPEDRLIASRMLPGYGYTPEGIAATVSRAGQVANAQGSARAAHRAPPRASAGRAPKTAKIPSGFILD